MIALYVDGRVDLDAILPDVEAAVRSLDGADHTLVVELVLTFVSENGARSARLAWSAEA
jgi:hypothetical protein